MKSDYKKSKYQKYKPALLIQNKSPHVIINADDFAISPGVNQAITQLAEIGIVTSTSVMSNMPYYQEIEKLNTAIGIGIHLNLTIGKPVLPTTVVPTLVDQEGNFHGFSTLIKNTKEGKISKEEVYSEFNSQIQQLLDLGIKPDHINTHQSLLKYPFFIPAIINLAKKHHIFAFRTYNPRKFDYKRLFSPKKMLISLYLVHQQRKYMREGFIVTNKFDSLLEINLNYSTAINKLKNIFFNLPNSTIEIAVHPGYCEGENTSLGSYIYEREVELKALLSNEFKTILADSGVNLISFNDINT